MKKNGNGSGNAGIIGKANRPDIRHVHPLDGNLIPTGSIFRNHGETDDICQLCMQTRP
jgi:hypothetical protein